MPKKAKEVAVKWLNSKAAGFTVLAYNTSLGGAERLQQRDIAMELNTRG